MTDAHSGAETHREPVTGAADAGPDTDRRVPWPATLLGYAGLLPPLVAILASLFQSRAGELWLVVALGYCGLILSFLGGMWWGAASAHRKGVALGGWLGLAVLPSLAALLAMLITLASASVLTGAVVLALSLILTLLVDRLALRAELVPAWWMRLRVPLSVSLAALALIAGLLLN